MTESDGTEARELDEQIAELERNIAEINESLSDAGAMDSEDRAAALNNREEIEGVLDGLRRRRRSL